MFPETHRVALDWLFDRINLDPKVQIKYIDTKKQLADILTMGNFTRDEWNHQTRGGLRMDIKSLKDMFLTIERGNPLKRQDQTLQKDYGLSWSSREWKSGRWRTRSIRAT